GFLFRRLDLFYGNTDSLFCGLRCGFDMGSVHRRTLLRLLRVRDAVIAGGRVGDGRVGEVHWLRDVLARHVGQLQPTAAAHEVAGKVMVWSEPAFADGPWFGGKAEPDSSRSNMMSLLAPPD